MLDDSISSGTSMQLACDTLREAGLRVEGGIFLVRFGWYGGFARMQEQGYRVDAVSDIWSDFIYHMDDEPRPTANPTRIFPEVRWSEADAPEGLHPAELARVAAGIYRGGARFAAAAAGARCAVSGWAAASGPACARATTSTFAMPATASGICRGSRRGRRRKP